MKYRIVKITKDKYDPEYIIKVWAIRYNPSAIFNKYPKDWVRVDRNGNPMKWGMYSVDQIMLAPFYDYENAKTFLDSILNYTPPKEQIVFET